MVVWKGKEFINIQAGAFHTISQYYAIIYILTCSALVQKIAVGKRFTGNIFAGLITICDFLSASRSLLLNHDLFIIHLEKNPNLNLYLHSCLNIRSHAHMNISRQVLSWFEFCIQPSVAQIPANMLLSSTWLGSKFQAVLRESVKLNALLGENHRTRGVGLLPHIALLVRKCLTLGDQYFRKLLLVSLPISQADKEVIAVCVWLELKWMRHSIAPHHLIPSQASRKWNSNPME